MPLALRRNISSVLGGWMVGLACALIPSGIDAEWLPSGTEYPRDLADPREPRLGLTFAPDPDLLDAALGTPLPIVSVPVSDLMFLAVLEAGVFMRLGREGSFYPVETVDGRFGAGLETRHGRAAARLRLLHESAHKADGDSTVTYPGDTFSREFWELELAFLWKRSSVYMRTGSSWHAVPSDPGMDLAIGAVWIGPGEGGRPFAAVHLNADNSHNWRVTTSALAGWETGRHRYVRFSLRLFNGLSHQGQYSGTEERYLGLDIQFTP